MRERARENKKEQAKIFFRALCPKRIVKLSHQDVINDFKTAFTHLLNIFERKRLSDGTHDDRGLAFVITYIITSFLNNPECSSFITSQIVEYIFQMLEQKKKYVFLRYEGFDIAPQNGKKNIFTSNFKDSWFVSLRHSGVLVFDNVTILEVMNHQSLLMSLWRVPVYNTKFQMYNAYKRVSTFEYFIRHLKQGKQHLDDVSDSLYQTIVSKQLMLGSNEKNVLLELSSSASTNYLVTMAAAVLDLAQHAHLTTEILSNKSEQKHTAMTLITIFYVSCCYRPAQICYWANEFQRTQKRHRQKRLI